MIGLIQRVSYSKVVVGQQIVGEIQQGITVLLAVEAQDTMKDAIGLATKIFNYRIFSDDAGKMNLSILEIHAKRRALPFSQLGQADIKSEDNQRIGLLIVPQFTLALATNKGNRPSFSGAAEPKMAKKLYEGFIEHAQLLANSSVDDLCDAYGVQGINIQTGIFGADMSVHIVNDGPVTFWLGT